MIIGKVFLSSFLISICSSFLTGIHVKKLEKQIFIKDLFIYESIPLVAHGNLVECAIRCAIVDGCMSIFYHKASRECRGTYTGYKEGHSSLGYSVAGWNYYLIYDGQCLLMEETEVSGENHRPSARKLTILFIEESKIGKVFTWVMKVVSTTWSIEMKPMGKFSNEPFKHL